MTDIAAENDTITDRAHARSLSPDVTSVLPDPAIENASAARTVMRANNVAPMLAPS
jgi:hypothetical protein